MRSKKRKLIVVTYGFHPQEYFAEEVGRRIGEMNLEDVVSVRFRPKCMPENVKELFEEGKLSWRDLSRIDRTGTAEQGDFLRKNFPDLGFLIDLHDTYNGLEDSPFAIRQFSHNRKLKKLLRLLKRIMGDELYLEIERCRIPKGYMLSGIDVDFHIPPIKGENKRYLTSPKILEKEEIQEFLDEAVEFTVRLVNWIKRYYLNPSERFYKVSLLFQ